MLHENQSNTLFRARSMPSGKTVEDMQQKPLLAKAGKKLQEQSKKTDRMYSASRCDGPSRY
jgi:hypothetical protein